MAAISRASLLISRALNSQSNDLIGTTSRQVWFSSFIRQVAADAYNSLAPQCPYPDAYIGTTLNAVGFDAVYVQFCRLHILTAIPLLTNFQIITIVA